MNSETLVRILADIQNDLKNGYFAYGSNAKDMHIKEAKGKVGVLLELAKEGLKK